ncbi:MAG: MG2 domain-containing protein, partial [candidate division WOR-3 bacterium]|nr:MG2 domain-containing protein [candidate division WOR-3 bacterium]
MRKYLLVIIFIFVITAMISCSRETKQEQTGEQISNVPAPTGRVEEDSLEMYGDERNLNIVSTKPQGRVYADNPAIVIMFDRDMIPLSGQLKSDTSTIISIEPAIRGIYHWKGTRIVEFTPIGKMDINIQYTVTVKKGTASYDKTYVLKKDYTFSFINKGFRYIGTYVDSNTSKKVISNAFPSKHTVYMKFNYPVKESSLNDKISVKDKNNKSVSINTYVMPNTPDIVAVEFPKRLKRKQLHKIFIDKDIQSDYGDCGMENDISFNIVTDREFELISYPKKLVNPNDYIFVQFTNPINRNNRDFYIIDENSDTVENKYIHKYYKGDNNYNISTNLKAAMDYTVIFPEAYTDYNGNEMTREFRFTFRTDDYNPHMSIPGYSILLEYYLSRRIPIYTVNNDSVSVFIRDVKDIYRDRYIYEGKVQCNTERNVYQTVPLEFGKLVNNEPGIYMMKHGSKTNDNYYVYLSNAAMMAKLSPAGMLVLVYDLKTGEPLKDADIMFKQHRGKTDNNGLCQLSFPCNTSAITNGFGPWNPVYYSKGDDRGGIILTGENDRKHKNAYFPPNFLSNRREMYYRTMLFAYNDRGLYKPGETAYIKIMHRYLSDKGLETGYYKEAEIHVYNSREEEILKKTLTLNKYGNAVLKVNIPENAPTGQYYAKIKVTKWAIQYNYFRVEEFKPLEFTVNMSSAKQYIEGSDTTLVSVNARYMYGAPMNGDTVFWSITASPQSFRPSGFNAYTFTGGNHFHTRQLLSGWGIIDENGYYDIGEIPDMKGITTTARLLYKARVKSMSGQEITQTCNIMYHPVNRYLGINASRYFYSSEEQPIVSLVCTDIDGNKQNISSIKLTLTRTSYYSVQKSGTGGRLYWEYEIVVDTMMRKTVGTSNGEYIYRGEKDLQSGNYTIYAEFEYKEHRYKTSCNFYKVGTGNAYWRMRNDNYIELIPDKGSSDYIAGDTAKILIKSPITGCRAFITLEREDIIETYNMDINSTVEVLKIPIKEEYFPNIYVSAFIYKGREKAFTEKDSIDLGKPKYGVGYCTLNVNSESKKLFVSLKTEAKQYEPQDSVHIDIDVRNNKGIGEKTELSLAVVDLGVLNLIGYQTPDPLSYFYKNRANSVAMFTNAGDVIGERNYSEKGENRGGGGADERFRAEFLSLVHYNGILETDENGRATAAIKLPDNLTTFRIMAVAGNKEKFGSSEHDITVSKTL